MSASSNRFNVFEEEPSHSKKQETHTRITDLPAEIRNEIYRYLLATDYVTKRKMNPMLKGFGRLILRYDRERPILRHAGHLRCQNVWIERSYYSLNILRVSRRIYQESSQIFSDNSWIFVRVNRSFFASALRMRGFNAIRLNSTQGMKVSILALSIRFPPSQFDSGSDTFVMSTTDAGKLQRALSTVTGLEEIKLTFIASPDFPKQSNPITKAFSDLRGVGIASVCGPGSRHSLGMMIRTISATLASTSDNKDAIMDLAQGRVRNSLSEAQAHQSNQEWHKTAAQCETSMAYIIDCHSIYFRRIRRDYKKWRFLDNTYRMLLTMLVEATFWIGDYDAVISYTEHVEGTNSGRNPILVGSVRDFRHRALTKLDERGVVSLAVLLNRQEENLPVGPSLGLPRYSEEFSSRFIQRFISNWPGPLTDSSTDSSD